MDDRAIPTTPSQTSTPAAWLLRGRDRLKLAGKMTLRAGEKLLDSDKVTGDFGVVRIAAVADCTGGVSIRMGLGGAAYGSRYDEAGPWRGAPDPTVALNAHRKALRDELAAVDAELSRLEADPELEVDPARKATLEARYRVLDDMEIAEVYPLGYTAVLDHQAVGQLRVTLTDSLAAAAKAQGVIDAHWGERERLEATRDSLRGMTRKWTPQEEARWDAVTVELEALAAAQPDVEYTVFAEGRVPAGWADVHYRVELDDPSMGVDVLLGGVPHGSDRTLDDLSGMDAAARLDQTQATKLLRILARYG